MPPLRSDVAKVLSSENPLFRHAEMQLFVARRGGRDVGRIAAILDRSHNEVHKEKAVFFGFFECEDDAETAARLFDAVALWGRERKMEIVRGPANPSLNDEAGLLVEGYGRDPVFMMTYNPPYYAGLIEGAGFVGAKDLLAYWFDLRPEPLERLARLAERVKRNEKDVVIRAVTKRSLGADIARIREVYNEAWEENWGFVPMTAEEMEFMAARLKPLLDPDMVFLAEHRRPDGSFEPVAFLLAMPDYNVALKAARGRLLPFGWLRFLLASRRIRVLRVVALGIKRDWRLRGLQSVMFEHVLRSVLKRGWSGCEVSWLLEDNDAILTSVRLFGGGLYKRYRLYSRPIT
ncbi:MAG TPA: N-acetyltransferase [Thermoanaerobaculia bacterium]